MAQVCARSSSTRPGPRSEAGARSGWRRRASARAVAFRSDLDPLTLLALRRLLARERVEVVVANFDKEVRLAGLAARSLGRRRSDGPIRVVCRKGLPLLADNWRCRLSYAHLVDGILTPARSIARRLRDRFPWLRVEITVVPVGESGPFADRLALNLGDPALRALFGAAARARAERELGLERMIDGVEAHLRRQALAGQPTSTR